MIRSQRGPKSVCVCVLGGSSDGEGGRGALNCGRLWCIETLRSSTPARRPSRRNANASPDESIATCARGDGARSSPAVVFDDNAEAKQRLNGVAAEPLPSSELAADAKVYELGFRRIVGEAGSHTHTHTHIASMAGWNETFTPSPGPAACKRIRQIGDRSANVALFSISMKGLFGRRSSRARRLVPMQFDFTPNRQPMAAINAFG